MRVTIWQDAFFLALERVGGRVSIAADLAGVHRQRVYEQIDANEQFRERYKAVLSALGSRRVERVRARLKLSA